MGRYVNRTKNKHEFTVLVTVYDFDNLQPFPNGGRHYDERDNTSHLITQHLPTHLPVSHALNPTSLPIRILNPTAPDGKSVDTSYSYIRSFVQKLWDEYEDEVDLVLHLGMADGWQWYTIERLAYNENFTSSWWSDLEYEGYYLIPDDNGETVRDIVGTDKGKWDGAPIGLGPTIDVDRAVDDSNMLVNIGCEDGISMEAKMIGTIAETGREEGKLKVSVVSHMEAGSYACGFIFYESLAQRWKRKLNTKVLFTHVPGWKDEERLNRGADAICSIMGSVCKQIEESWNK